MTVIIPALLCNTPDVREDHLKLVCYVGKRVSKLSNTCQKSDTWPPGFGKKPQTKGSEILDKSMVIGKETIRGEIDIGDINELKGDAHR